MTQADRDFQEWTECRSTIGRFDGVIADTRKYGFTLVAILLTANALITPANLVVDRVAGASVVMALVLVLFLIDRYWWVMLVEADSRAITLEHRIGFELSWILKEASRSAHNTTAASVVYQLFLVLAAAIALVAIVPTGWPNGVGVLILLVVGASTVLWFLHYWFAGRASKAEQTIQQYAPGKQDHREGTGHDARAPDVPR